MKERERFRPFTGDSNQRILLANAPLSLVLCQVRWPDLSHLQLNLKEFALQFGVDLKDYPLFQESQEVAYLVTPEGVQQDSSGVVYQWRTVDGAWNVSLGKRFLTLHCTNYTTYEEFGLRLEQLLVLVKKHLNVPVVERIGYRYVNQLTNPNLLQDLSAYVNQSVLGYSSVLGKGSETRVVSSSNQALYAVEDVMLQVRSGIVPAGQTIDPSIPVKVSDSWVLDLDAFSANSQTFDANILMKEIAKLSDAAYDFFKYIVTDGFIKEFGG